MLVGVIDAAGFPALGRVAWQRVPRFGEHAL